MLTSPRVLMETRNQGISNKDQEVGRTKRRRQQSVLRGPQMTQAEVGMSPTLPRRQTGPLGK